MGYRKAAAVVSGQRHDGQKHVCKRTVHYSHVPYADEHVALVWHKVELRAIVLTLISVRWRSLP